MKEYERVTQKQGEPKIVSKRVYYRLRELEDKIENGTLKEVVRCKDCKYHHRKQEPEHGKTIHLCSVLNAEVFKDFYCYYGTQKERDGEK